MSELKLVVFDVDGTLCDSQHHIVAAMEHAFAAEDLPCPPRDAILAIVGLSLPVAMACLVPELPGVVQERLVAAYKAGYMAERTAWLAPLYDGIAGVIGSLSERRDVILGVATGKSRRGLDQLLDGHGLGGVFYTRQVADDHPSKPHPSMLLTAMAEAGVAPDRTVMIGDTTYDMRMGRAAGASTLAVTWGYHDECALMAERPDGIVRSVAGISGALTNLWGQA
jgi:phosphoglycolate phosphatase